MLGFWLNFFKLSIFSIQKFQYFFAQVFDKNWFRNFSNFQFYILRFLQNFYTLKLWLDIHSTTSHLLHVLKVKWQKTFKICIYQIFSWFRKSILRFFCVVYDAVNLKILLSFDCHNLSFSLIMFDNFFDNFIYQSCWYSLKFV